LGLQTIEQENGNALSVDSKHQM